MDGQLLWLDGSVGSVLCAEWAGDVSCFSSRLVWIHGMDRKYTVVRSPSFIHFYGFFPPFVRPLVLANRLCVIV